MYVVGVSANHLKEVMPRGKETDRQVTTDAQIASEGDAMVAGEQNKDAEREEVTEAEVKVYVEKNKIRFEDETYGQICVDGRYNEENHAKEAIAVPGAHLGVPMALLDARFGLSAQEAFDVYNAFLASKGQAFVWHTDDHEGHDGCIVGCGHCNAAIKNSKEYGLEEGKVSDLLQIVRAYQERSQTEQLPAECVVLHEGHKELGVLVINSEHYTVEHSDDTGTQYFGYDAQRYMKVVEEFVAYVQKEYADADFASEVQFEALQEVLGAHTNTTLGLLGSSQGKPIFEVNISEEGEVTVTKVDNAPVIKPAA